MDIGHPSARWLKRLSRGGQPVYLALVDALELAIREGELQAGDQLPPQRTVAELIGVDFTTVTRAYGAARSRGLVEGAVGRGTFVRAPSIDDEAGLVDLSMNLPPPPMGVSLAGLLKDTSRSILERTDAATLMAYHPGAGTLGQKTVGAAWLAPLIGDVKPERILVCPGAQTGLASILSVVCRPGDALLVEPLTYPGLLALARQLSLRLIACPVDDQGLMPDALDRLCAEQRPAALYVVPTTQNPTATTMPLERRREIADIATARGVWLIEDDPYSRLFDAPAPAIATLAPERSFYLGTVSKTLSPGLRTAFLLPPNDAVGEQVAAALRSISLMGSPLMTAVLTRWIRDGAAEQLLAGVRLEARARMQLANQILPTARGAPEGIHIWLPMPTDWKPEALHAAARQRGLSLVEAEVFAAGGPHPMGVRISLGGPLKRSVLEASLGSIAALLGGAAPAGRTVV